MEIGKPNICIVGNLVGLNAGKITTQGIVLADLLRSDGYDVISVSSKLNRLLRIAEMILTIVWHRRSIDILIVEIYSGLSFLIADVIGLLGKYLRVQTIGVLHGGALPEFISKNPKWGLRVLRRFDQLAAPSAYLKTSFDDLDLKVRIIPNVIDLSAYTHRLRRKVAPRLIWMRAFHSIYNPELAIEAFALICRRYENASLVMAGVDKGLETTVKQLARDLGVDGKVRFPGFLSAEAKVREFSEANIYLNTNNIDNMPVAVVEACAFGLPVIATDVGGIASLLNDGLDGLLVPAGDPECMADAVTRLIDDPDLASRLSKRGRLLAERSSWGSVKSRWENLFRELGFPDRVPRSAATTGERTV